MLKLLGLGAELKTAMLVGGWFLLGLQYVTVRPANLAILESTSLGVGFYLFLIEVILDYLTASGLDLEWAKGHL